MNTEQLNIDMNNSLLKDVELAEKLFNINEVRQNEIDNFNLSFESKEVLKQSISNNIELLLKLFNRTILSHNDENLNNRIKEITNKLSLYTKKKNYNITIKY